MNMSPQEAELWSIARRARDKLADQFLDHPDVSLIAIGYAPEVDEGTRSIALRIHVRERWFRSKPEERVTFPADVDGIPVVVVPAAYRLEPGHPPLDEEQRPQ